MTQAGQTGSMVSEPLLDSIYGIVTDDDALGIMLARLADHFRCISGAFVFLDPVRPGADVALGHGLFSDDVRARYHADFAFDDPAPAALAALQIGEAAATDRLFSPEQRASSRFLRDFYFPLGLREALGAPVARTDGRFGIVAVHRGPERPAFDTDEIAAFGELASHLTRAVAMRGKFFVVQRAAERLRDMIDGIAAGLMTFDPAGRLTDANACARSILARRDGLILTRSGRLGADDRRADARLRESFVADPGDEDPTVVAVPNHHEARASYAVRVSRLGTESAAAFLVHVADPRQPSADFHVVLARAMKLTVPSARVVASLLAGEDLRSHAAKVGISINTAKFHLNAAFRATGVQRQADLIRLAATVLHDLAF